MLDQVSEILTILSPILMSPVAGCLLVALVVIGCSMFLMHFVLSGMGNQMKDLTDAAVQNGNKLDNVNENLKDLVDCLKDSIITIEENPPRNHHHVTSNRFKQSNHTRKP